MTDEFLCPRRDEHGLMGEHPFKIPAKDHWREPTKMRPHRTCSFCGSLHPMDFMVAMLNGALVTPTDKDYKAYIDLPHPDPEGSKLISVVDYQPPPTGFVPVTPAQAKEHGWGERESPIFGLWSKNGPTDRAKFYFPHLDTAQAQKFIEALNARWIKLAAPGHFYVLPFFVKREEVSNG